MKPPTNQEKRKWVMARLPIKDDPAQPITWQYAPPERSSTARWHLTYFCVDVRPVVMQLLKEGKVKRIRKYGYGHSGRAGHTYFVANEN